MKPELLPLVIENLSVHESRERSMYLDTKGYVTAGVGHLIAKSEDAVCLDWHRIDRKATRGEIVDDWAAVKYGGRKRGLLFLPEEEIDRLLAFDLGRFESQLESVFDLVSLPDQAVIALFDIAHQTGSVSPRNWPKLTAAIRAADWQTAAAQCFRPDAGKGRNEDTKNQFLSLLPETQAA